MPAVLYFAVPVVILLLFVSKTFRAIIFGAIVFAALLGLVLLPLHGALAEETRRVEVTKFVFEREVVIIEDEDGYTWECPFGRFNWAVGEEYELYIPDEGQPQIREPQ